MKRKEHTLLYHTLHSRPMPGCLPLFFTLALAVTVGIIWVVPVKMPERVRPRGVGAVHMKEGRLADFIIRRNSPLPLHLPMHADPEFREDASATAMPLLHPVRVLTPPRQPIFDDERDSAVLNPTDLLALPEVRSTVTEAEARLIPVTEPSPAPAAAAAPIFHPGVDNEPDVDGEEVQP